MSEIITILSSVISLIGALVAVWSILHTRRQFYDEYLKKRKESFDNPEKRAEVLKNKEKFERKENGTD